MLARTWCAAHRSRGYALCWRSVKRNRTQLSLQAHSLTRVGVPGLQRHERDNYGGGKPSYKQQRGQRYSSRRGCWPAWPVVAEVAAHGGDRLSRTAAWPAPPAGRRQATASHAAAAPSQSRLTLPITRQRRRWASMIGRVVNCAGSQCRRLRGPSRLCVLLAGLPALFTVRWAMPALPQRDKQVQLSSRTEAQTAPSTSRRSLYMTFPLALRPYSVTS
jgi:hypothetical protein